MLRLTPDASVTSFSALNAPVAEVTIGEAFECDTFDCYAGQISSEAVLRPQIDMQHFNRATGPVRVTGVDAGDAICVVIEAIELTGSGVMALSPGLGVLGARIQQPETRVVPIRDGFAWVTDEVAVAVNPMIGVLGVAPEGDAVPTSWPGAHGGNLDTRVLQAGAALLLRAQQPGALLAVGDLHAVQGDGELGGTGVEIAGRVRLRVERSGYSGTLPAVRRDEGLSVLASADTLDQAVREGFAEVVALIGEWRGLRWEDAYRVASLIVCTEVSQMVNPLKTARLTIPREWCPDSLYAAEPHE